MATSSTSKIMNASFLVSFMQTGNLNFSVNDAIATEDIAEKNQSVKDYWTVRRKLLDPVTSNLATTKSLVSCMQKIYRGSGAFQGMTRGYEKGKRLLPVQFIKPAVVSFNKYPSSIGCNKYELSFPKLVFKPLGMSVADFQKQIGEPPTTTWWLFQQAFNAAEMLFETELEVFFKNYEKAVDKAKVDLGTAFNKDDYRSVEDLRESFGMELVREIPTEEDARRLADIFGVAEIEQVKRDAEIAQEKKMQDSVDKAVELTLQPVSHLIKSLDDRINWKEEDGGRAPSIPDSLIDNLRNASTSLKLQVGSSDRVQQACEQLELLADTYSPKALKSDALTREIAKDEAEQVLKDVQGITNNLSGIIM